MAEKRRVPAVGEGKRGIEGHLLYLLRQANSAVQAAQAQALADLELTPSQYSALTMIKAYGAVSNAELARITLLRPQTIHEVTLRLEAAGWISRAPDPAHKRIALICITKSGETLLAEARRRTDAIEDVLREQASPDLASLKRWLVTVASAYAQTDTVDDVAGN